MNVLWFFLKSNSKKERLSVFTLETLAFPGILNESRGNSFLRKKKDLRIRAFAFSVEGKFLIFHKKIPLQVKHFFNNGALLIYTN